jgi:hypothetical protein
MQFRATVGIIDAIINPFDNRRHFHDHGYQEAQSKQVGVVCIMKDTSDTNRVAQIMIILNYEYSIM